MVPVALVRRINFRAILFTKTPKTTTAFSTDTATNILLMMNATAMIVMTITTIGVNF